jgi:predicted enzyme related to lactoylglutathione lyase
LHIDVRVAGPGPWDVAESARLIRQKVPELVAAGAAVLHEQWYGDTLGHVVMQDPEGNEFCVA